MGIPQSNGWKIVRFNQRAYSIRPNNNNNIELFDVVGMNVGAYRIRPTEEETVIDISHLAAGLYFLKVDGKTVKVVKE